MNPRRQVANAPGKPVMLYDADCRFCLLWVRRWQECTGDSVDYRALQDESVAADFPELPRDALEQAVHLIESDGVVSVGAEAVFRSLANQPRYRGWMRLYQRFPALAQVAEWGYRAVAEHRVFWSGVTRLLWGDQVSRPQHVLVRWTFLRALSLVYLVAFASLWVQITGLIGENGILPAGHLMSAASGSLDEAGVGVDRYRLLPTLCWMNAGDGFLQFQCGAGMMLAALALVGIAPKPCFALLWALYLSLTTVGQVFLGFQWDNLLLETGLLAIFFAPWTWHPAPAKQGPPSRAVLWLLRLLMFKLMFLSGVVKLASGDETWADLTALTYHYETQPLSNWVAWHAHQLPVWCHKMCCGVMFFIELVVPFFIFAPRRPRMVAAALLAFLQLTIIVTGNYTFFNWLTLALCVPLLDDFALARILPRGLTDRHGSAAPPRAPCRSAWHRWAGLAMAGPVALVISISSIQLLSPLGSPPGWTTPIARVHRWLAPFRSINSYGLFAVMTTERPEIMVEGSNDSVTWQAYEFHHKPGDLRRRPGFVAPHQPRLDWQMWFAALGDARRNPWFVNFCVRLLQGEPAVLRLLESNPFPDQPPRYVRAVRYNYTFTTREERRHTGAWWKREYRGVYLPIITLNMVEPTPAPESPP